LSLAVALITWVAWVKDFVWLPDLVVGSFVELAEWQNETIRRVN